MCAKPRPKLGMKGGLALSCLACCPKNPSGVAINTKRGHALRKECAAYEQVLLALS